MATADVDTARRRRFVDRAKNVLGTIGNCVWLYRRRIATRRHLRELESHRLADIGSSDAERARECRKWFWQD